MSTESEDIIRQLQQYSATKMAGAVRTFPFRQLLKNERFIRNKLQNRQETSSSQREELQKAYDKLELVTAKRVNAARQIIAKFLHLSPEIMALNNSVFSLVPSRDLLEDVRTAYVNSEKSLEGLSAASANILEAVNIEIQQRFSRMSPENIAVSNSEDSLDAYRRLLKGLLSHIEVDSEIFRIYSKIIRNVIEGSRIYESHIKSTHDFCKQIFDSDPPSFTSVFNNYDGRELESYYATVQSTLEILQHDVTKRPSVITFTGQCQQVLDSLSDHFIDRRNQMRKASRVLQLSHYISLLTPEQVSENASTILIICQVLFEETQKFLITQRSHLDVSLNLNSIEDAQQKVQEGLHYRQVAIGQLFQEISKLSSADLSIVPEKRLEDNNLLLQESLHFVEDYIQRMSSDPPPPIIELANSLRENIQKLHEAIALTTISPDSIVQEAWEFERALPNLSKFYDEELVRVIRKTLNFGSSSSFIDEEDSIKLEASFIIPLVHLRHYIGAFINISNIR